MQALHNKWLWVVTAVLLAQSALFYTAYHGDSVPLSAPLSTMPMAMSGWTLDKTLDISEETRSVLRADDLMNRTYSGPGGIADLFVAYFMTQRAGQSPHSPKNCLPGSGFEPVENGTIDVPVRDGSIRINRYVVSNGDREDVVLYWYQSHGRVIADEFAAKYYLVADSIRYHRSDTALVRVVVGVANNNRAGASQAAIDFVKASYPVVSSWLPS